MLAVLYWDPDQMASNNNVNSGAGLGGSGTWMESVSRVWFNPLLNNGTGGHVSWNSSLGDTAVFVGPTGGTVSISGGVSAAGVEFRSANFLVTGGDFTTAANGTTFTATADGRFITPIAGNGGITKAGAMKISLEAPASAYTGTTLVAAGVLDVQGTIQSHVQVAGGTVSGVLFNDPDLAAAVREAFAFDPAEWLTAAKIKKINAATPLTSLTVNGTVVGDLKGIESLTSLTSLELIPADYAATPQGISSLAPLTALTNLTALTLQDVGLTNSAHATLPSLPRLTRLDVRYNALSTVPAATATLPQLGTLLVHGNPLLTDNPRAGLAALKGKAVDVDVAPDRPEIATSIADLAERLYYLPLAMLEYVTNTIVFQPYVGAMKGPLAALQTKAGNDWDTNALLAGLYAEAGIQTRYVAGVAEVTQQQLLDYVGAREVAAAARILAAAGLNYDSFANRFKHTWIEASLNVPATGSTAWVPIDASWKLRDYRPGLPGVLTSVPFSVTEVDYLTDPQWQTKSTAEYYEAKVANWLAANRPDLTIADVAYDGPIRQQSFKSLSTTLPYKVVSQPADDAKPTVIPETARYTVNIKLADGSTPLFGDPGVDLTLTEVALSRLTIDPGIKTVGDTRTATPALRRDGSIVKTASSSVQIPASATPQITLTISISRGGTLLVTRAFPRGADRFIAIGLDANQFSESSLATKRAIANAEQLKQANNDVIDNELAIGGLLDLTIAQFFTAANADEASLAGLTSAVADRTLVALGIATSGPTLLPATTDTARLQFPYLPQDIGIDVPANVVGAYAIDATQPETDLTRMVLMGYSNSSQEALVIEELTNCESVSTVKALQKAAARELAAVIPPAIRTPAEAVSQACVEINKDNVGNIATLLSAVRPQIRGAIASAVNAGLGLADYAGITFKALVPRKEIMVGGGAEESLMWKGLGYTLTCVTSDASKAHLNGKTVGFMITGAVGSNPVTSSGGAASRVTTPPVWIKPITSISNPALSAGDPVNMATGGVYHEETDVEVPNLGVPLAFRRRYDSIHTVSGLPNAPDATSNRGMGEGWSFTYSDRIEQDIDGADTVTWFTDTGTRLVFPSLGVSAGFGNPTGLFGTLTGSVTTGFTWKDYDGNTISFRPAVAGYSQIASKSDRFGNGVQISYVAATNRISTVTDLRDPTRRLTFAYTTVGSPAIASISSITDFTGRTWTYTYQPDGRLQARTAPAPTPGAAAPVVRYTYHTGNALKGLLASVTDPGGFVTSWEYYASRRGFRVTDAESLQHSFAYNQYRRQSSFIDERGNVSRYIYDTNGNLLTFVRPDRTTESSAWNSAGLRVASTDAFGAKTTYAYDTATGKVTSVTDPKENVTTTVYTTGAFRDVAAITHRNKPDDPTDDVTTTFTYDAAGYLTSRTDDAGVGRLNLTTRFVAATNSAANGVVPLTVDATPTTSGKVRANGVLVDTARGGVDYKAVADAGYTAVAAQSLAGQNTLVWRHSSGFLHFWRCDASWNWTESYGAVMPGSREFDACERLLGIDLDDDAKAGQDVTIIESIGGVVLSFDVDAAARIRVNGLLVNAAAGGVSYSGYIEKQYTAVAADFDPGAQNTPTIVWRHSNGALVRWRLTNEWNSIASNDFQPNTEAYFSVETSFNMDFNGDGRIGNPSLPQSIVEQRGTVTLAIDRAGNLTANGTAVKSHGGDVNYAALVATGYTAAAAESILGRNTIVWRTSAGLHFWDLDITWNVTRTYGLFPTGGPDHGVIESVLGMDFNDDRGVGLMRGLTSQTISPRGVRTTIAYNAAGQTIFQASAGPPGSVVAQFSAYDARGNAISKIDPNGNSSSGVFDALGRQMSNTSPDPDGDGPLTANTATFTYDASGNNTRTVDSDGRVVATRFDRRQRVIRTTAADSTFTSCTYDAAGNVATSTDAAGRITKYFYDARNKLIATLFPDGSAARSRFDGGSRLVASIDGGGATTTTAYDTLGRRIRRTQPDPDGSGPLPSPVSEWGYDSRGNVQFVTASFGRSAGAPTSNPNRSTEYTYDALGRVLSETQADPDGSGPLSRPVTYFGYTSTGPDIRSVRDPNGVFRTTVYDSFGRLTQNISADPDGPDGPLSPLGESYVYDPNGNLRFEVGPGGAGAADVSFTTEHVYDALNREVRTVLPDPDGPNSLLTRPTSSRAFNASGYVASATDAAGRTTAYRYDSVGRVVAVVDAVGSIARTAYDAVGNAVITTDALGRLTFTGFDALNRPATVRGPRPDAVSTTPVATSAYDATGNLIRSVDALGRIISRQYDALGRLTALTNPLGRTAGDAQAASRIEYDSAGRVTATIDELGRRTDVDYDNLGRKVREIAPDAGLGRAVTHYGYDAAGNLRYTTDPRGFAVTDSGFERPALAAGTLQYRPSGTAWTFAGSAGVAGNGSVLTSGNPEAPAGSQVLFLQGNDSSATQDVADWQAGSYVLSFRAARRGDPGTGNFFRVLVDGKQVGGSFKPSLTSYESFTTIPFTVTAGVHTISFRGLEAGASFVSLIDDVRIERVANVLADASFERVALGSALFQRQPADTAWSFTGDAYV